MYYYLLLLLIKAIINHHHYLSISGPRGGVWYQSSTHDQPFSRVPLVHVPPQVGAAGEQLGRVEGKGAWTRQR